MTHMLMAPHPTTDGTHNEQKIKLSWEDKEGMSYLWQIRMKKKHEESTYQEVFLALLHDETHPALPIGILRKFDDGRLGGLGYVWTNPSPDVRMQMSDLIFVLVDTAFGKVAYEQGLLPFSGEAAEEISRCDW